MSAHRLTPERAHALFAAAPERHVDLLDRLERAGGEDLEVYADDPDRPVDWAAVQWGAGPMGMTSQVDLEVGRLRGLEEVLAAIPRGRGRFEILCPFWTAPLVEQEFRTEVQGPVSRYRLPPGVLGAPHPVASHTRPLDEDELGYMGVAFPRSVPEAPHRALVLKDELVAVAVTISAASGHARFGVHVMEEHRGHGFGTGVAHALLRDLVAAGWVPVAEVALADAPSVRMVESLGLTQLDTRMRVSTVGRFANL